MNKEECYRVRREDAVIVIKLYCNISWKYGLFYTYDVAGSE
jgi:hypothetical protein